MGNMQKEEASQEQINQLYAQIQKLEAELNQNKSVKAKHERDNFEAGNRMESQNREA